MRIEKESSLRGPVTPATTTSSESALEQKTAAAWVELRSTQQPDAIAVSSATQSISFSELASASSVLASRLFALNVTIGSPVAIYLPSSTHLVVAALAAWKAGAPYLPIDVTSPVERVIYMLRDSGAEVVITLTDLADALPGGPWKTILLDKNENDNGEATQTSTGDQITTKRFADRVPALDDLAYLIYTSGSTGKPKGVEITHRNLLHLVDWHVRAFGVTAQDRATQIAGPAFDAAVWEIWPHLCCGASLHIPPLAARYSAALLQEWLLAEKISISFVPTILAEEIVQLPWPASSDLRILLTGGDALHTFPPAGLPFALVNNYGPTEATVVATSAVVPSSSEPKAAPAIGKAILNTGILLLDEAGQNVVDGEVGEIIITGASVGRGYRNQPEMTAARFVTLEVDGILQRAFRTGDLARRLPDGQLAFAGRADGQVKIRGFRIELDDVAFSVNQHPAVLSSAVVTNRTGAEKQLVAYLVLRNGEEIVDAQLRDFLGLRLPEHMIPAQFAVLDRIPMTENGKLDTEALPAPTEINRLAHDPYEAPRNDIERIVQGVLSAILGQDRVGLHDNFFLLGGHSLMGAQVIARLRDTFGVELTLRDVFENPSVISLATTIELLLTKKLEAMTDEEVLAQLEAHGDPQPISAAGASESRG